MQNGKRIIALLLCVLLMIPMLPTAFAAEAATTAEPTAVLTLTQESVADFENGKTAQVELRVTNNGAKEQSTELILALYEEVTNKMCGYVSENLKIAANGQQTWTGKLEIPAEGTYVLKAFAWDDFQQMNLLSNVLQVKNAVQKVGTVTLSIEKRTIGKGDLIPAEEVEIQEGDTAWTLLEREMKARDIEYEATFTPGYGSVYIQSIQGDGERDHGPASGWMYYVNDEMPPYGVSKYELQNGDTLRLRYTAQMGDLNEPLVERLKSVIDETENMLAQDAGKYSEQSVQAVRDALAAAKKIAEDDQYNSTANDKELVVSAQIGAINAAVSKLEPKEEPPVGPDIPSVDGVPADWENDIWLNSDFERLAVGETYNIYARRLPELVQDSITNSGLTLPPMHYNIISGEDVVSVENKTVDGIATPVGVVTAKKEGVAVIQVYYDEVKPAWSDKTYGACSPVNYAYMTIEVNNDPADVEIATDLDKLNPDSKGMYHTKGTTFDTVYFAEGSSVPYTFTANAEGADLVVSCNGEVLTGNNGTYTANLKNCTNVIQIAATKDGKTKMQAYSIDARKIEITVSNKTNPGKELQAGDEAMISFKGIVIPVSKLATIYNPCANFGWGDQPAGVQYTVNGEEVYGRCGQEDLATKNTITFKFEKEGTYTFADGCIDMSWWGAKPNEHKTMTGPGKPNLSADTLRAKMGVMPEFTVTVAKATERPVTGLEIRPGIVVGEVVEGDDHTIQLNVEVQPSNATNPKVTWSSDNEKVATVDENGKVTCVGVGSAVITATSVENPDVKCRAEVTVVQELPATYEEKNNLRNLVFEVDSMDAKNYTPDSWEKLQTARDEAVKVLDDEDVLLAQVESAYAALEQAKNELQQTELDLNVIISPDPIHPGDTVTIVLENLEIPNPDAFAITARKTIYNSNIPGLEKIESEDGRSAGETIRTLAFQIPEDAQPGSYLLIGGHVYCKWIVNPQIMLTGDKNFYEGRMPEIQIEVVAK